MELLFDNPKVSFKMREGEKERKRQEKIAVVPMTDLVMDVATIMVTSNSRRHTQRQEEDSLKILLEFGKIWILPRVCYNNVYKIVVVDANHAG
ncbi:hypothetical protein E2542_SST09011 [Spatholobus suberectus]|nr:hypothetical protein E2542_SST09011 [Spatholobus suberectus]